VTDTAPFAVPFTWGAPFTLGVYATARAALRSSLTTGPNESTVNFASTATWGGIGSVYHNDQPVADYAVDSASGTDWRLPHPVPEPGTLSALVLGLAALVARRRRAAA